MNAPGNKRVISSGAGGCYKVRDETHLKVRAASRPVWAGSWTSSQPAASGPAPGLSGLWTPGPGTRRPREPCRRCRTCWAAEPTESSSRPRRRSSLEGSSREGGNKGPGCLSPCVCSAVGCEMETSRSVGGTCGAGGASTVHLPTGPLRVPARNRLLIIDLAAGTRACTSPTSKPTILKRTQSLDRVLLKTR